MASISEEVDDTRRLNFDLIFYIDNGELDNYMTKRKARYTEPIIEFASEINKHLPNPFKLRTLH